MSLKKTFTAVLYFVVIGLSLWCQMGVSGRTVSLSMADCPTGLKTSLTDFGDVCRIPATLLESLSFSGQTFCSNMTPQAVYMMLAGTPVCSKTKSSEPSSSGPPAPAMGNGGLPWK